MFNRVVVVKLLIDFIELGVNHGLRVVLAVELVLQVRQLGEEISLEQTDVNLSLKPLVFSLTICFALCLQS